MFESQTNQFTSVPTEISNLLGARVIASESQQANRPASAPTSFQRQRYLGGTVLTGEAARQAQFANLTANVPQQPKGAFFAK